MHAHRISIFSTKDGSLISTFGSVGTGNFQFSNPFGLCLDHDLNLYVCDTENSRIQKYNKHQEFLMTLELKARPLGVAISKTGNIIVTSSYCTVYSPSGKLLLKFGTKGRDDLRKFVEPRGVAVDNSDNIIIADCFRKSVRIFDSSGNRIRKIFGFFHPNGVCVDAGGNIVVVDSSRHLVVLSSFMGENIGSFGAKGKEDGDFANPKGVAVDWNGDIAVADPTNRRVVFFRPKTDQYIM